MSDGFLKNVWAGIAGWVEQNAEHYLYVPIPFERTQRTNLANVVLAQDPLSPDASYFRLWLCEMFLSNSREWFRDWYPAVHSSVRLKFANQDAKFSTVSQAPKEALSKGVLLNYNLTELIPYKGGTVELEAALLALKGSSFIDAGITVLKSFAGLITPPLSQVLEIAEKVTSGIETFLKATDGNVHLGLHQAFVAQKGGNVLRPGYFTAILGTKDNLDKDKLSVTDDRLLYNNAPLEGFDYMLFCVEGRTERDDWRLKNIEELLNKATESLLKGEKDAAVGYKKAALIAAFTSPDFVQSDKIRVAQAIKDEFAQIEQQAGLAAVPSELRDLNAIMQTRAMSRDEAMARKGMSLDQLLAD